MLEEACVALSLDLSRGQRGELVFLKDGDENELYFGEGGECVLRGPSLREEGGEE